MQAMILRIHARKMGQVFLLFIGRCRIVSEISMMAVVIYDPRVSKREGEQFRF